MNLAELSPVEQIETVEQAIREINRPPDIETKHYFAGGVYEREIHVPAGSLITGKIHLTEHLAKLTKGTMTIFANGESNTFTGPCTFVSQPGIKRMGYAHDDCVFSNFHFVGDIETAEEAEKLLVVDTNEQYLIAQQSEVKKLWHS